VRKSFLSGVAEAVSHRHLEVVIGRLVTDEEFRRQFINAPSHWIDELAAAGLELSAAELAALRRTDTAIWRTVSDALDPRLQKASLRSTPQQPEPDL
jgi:hypothetical protein